MPDLKPTQSPQTPRWLQRLPNQLTFVRMLCIPLVVSLMLQSSPEHTDPRGAPQWTDAMAGLVFVLAAVTDFLDGWIARRFKVETVLGKLLDPLADKLLHVSALIILVERHRMAGWIAVLLIVRDLAINAVRISAMEQQILIAPSFLAKVKSAFLDVAIGGLIIHGTIFYVLQGYIIGNVALWLALFASVVSGGMYLFEYGKHLNSAKVATEKTSINED